MASRRWHQLPGSILRCRRSPLVCIRERDERVPLERPLVSLEDGCRGLVAHHGRHPPALELGPPDSLAVRVQQHLVELLERPWRAGSSKLVEVGVALAAWHRVTCIRRISIQVCAFEQRQPIDVEAGFHKAA